MTTESVGTESITLTALPDVARHTTVTYQPLPHLRITVRTPFGAPDVVHIEVQGDVDMCSAAALCDVVAERAVIGAQIVLDLGGCGFFGSSGLSVIDTLERSDAGWALVTGRAANRLLRAAAATERIPAFHTVDRAIAELAVSLG